MTSSRPAPPASARSGTPLQAEWRDTFDRAVAAHRAGDTAAAEPLYRAAAQRTDDPAPSRLLSLLLAEAGQTDEALRWADRAVALDPGSAHSHAARGRVLLRAGQLGAAERALGDALALDPALAAARSAQRALGEVWHRQGQAMFRKRRWDGAATAFAAAARLLPGHAAARHDLGTALHETGMMAAAAAAYREALALAPDRAETWHNLGSVRQAMRDMDGALAAYARAHALRPDSFPRIAQELAAGNRGGVWLHAGDLRQTLARLAADAARP